MNFRAYGLLHLCEGNPDAGGNEKFNDFNDQVNVYLNCAITLSNSLRSKDVEFVLLTNSKFELERVKPVGTALRIEEIPFATIVPDGTPFYSAHSKLDAFRYLSGLTESYVALCDVDMVCLNDFPNCLSHIIRAGIPLCYDISDQVIPAWGRDVVVRNLQLVHNCESEGRWYGGEFVAGPPAFFSTLARECNRIYGNYIKNIDHISYVAKGDEPTTSAALEMIRKGGTYVADAGPLGIIGRFWNWETRHPQRPLEYFQQGSLLHLPSDKRFLAGLSQEPTLTSCKFLSEYQAYRNRHRQKRVRDVVRPFIPEKMLQWMRNRRHARRTRDRLRQANSIPAP